MDEFGWDDNDFNEILDALDELPSPPRFTKESEDHDSSTEFIVDAKRRKIDSCANKQSPLGLTLHKSPSFMDLIEMKLSQKLDALPNDLTQSIRTEKQMIKVEYKTRPIPTKLKASNFPAKMLIIGTWKREAQNEGDVIAKFYYAKRKLLWEILDNGLKKKIEINWSDITGIRANFAEDQPGVFEIELKQQPSFFGEIDPQPRKHTFWQPISDFTQGQASLIRRHYLEFPKGILEKHYERLLSCDGRLLKLNQKSFPIYSSPFFENVINEIQGFHINKTKFPSPCNKPFNNWKMSHIRHGENKRNLTTPLQRMRASKFLDPSINSSYSIPVLTPTVGVTHAESPSSVMEFPPFMDPDAIGAPSTSYCLEKNNAFINSMFGMDSIQQNKLAQYGDPVIQNLQSAYDIVEGRSQYLPPSMCMTQLRSQPLPPSEDGSVDVNEGALRSIDEQFFWELNGLPTATCIDEKRVAMRENSMTPGMNIAIPVHSQLGYNLDGTNLIFETKDYKESNNDKELDHEDEMLFKLSRLASYALGQHNQGLS